MSIEVNYLCVSVASPVPAASWRRRRLHRWRGYHYDTETLLWLLQLEAPRRARRRHRPSTIKEVAP